MTIDQSIKYCIGAVHKDVRKKDPVSYLCLQLSAFDKSPFADVRIYHTLFYGLILSVIAGALKIRCSLVSSSGRLPLPHVGWYVGHVINNLALRIR